jgi:hypothetical protein
MFKPTQCPVVFTYLRFSCRKAHSAWLFWTLHAAWYPCGLARFIAADVRDIALCLQLRHLISQERQFHANLTASHDMAVATAKAEG